MRRVRRIWGLRRAARCRLCRANPARRRRTPDAWSDAAYFRTEYQGISPGEIVTIFGSGLGPSPGVGFQLVNGQAPTSLGGTQVLVDGEPAPILYSSYGQVNLIIPYSLTIGTKPSIQVVSNEMPANTLSSLEAQAAGITIFQLNGTAAALNQDGTINSAQNPARPGSTVALFGTGGGQTNPASVAGEITPPELRPLIAKTQIYVDTNSLPAVQLSIEYAGAAPELLSGVTQVNVTLPEVIPATYYPPGVLPLSVQTNGQPFRLPDRDDIRGDGINPWRLRIRNQCVGSSCHLAALRSSRRAVALAAMNRRR
jgi:uncharacterized protein (TIGR03437 family)